MNTLVMSLAMLFGHCDCECVNSERREVVEQHLYEQGYHARINQRFWLEICSRDERRYWLRVYVLSACVLVAVGCVCAAIYYYNGHLIVAAAALVVVPGIAVLSQLTTCNKHDSIRDAYCTLSYKYSALEIDLGIEGDRSAERIAILSKELDDTMMHLENREPPMENPEEEKSLLEKCQREQNVYQGSEE